MVTEDRERGREEKIPRPDDRSEEVDLRSRTGPIISNREGDGGTITYKFSTKRRHAAIASRRGAKGDSKRASYIEVELLATAGPASRRARIKVDSLGSIERSNVGTCWGSYLVVLYRMNGSNVEETL